VNMMLPVKNLQSSKELDSQGKSGTQSNTRSDRSVVGTDVGWVDGNVVGCSEGRPEGCEEG
jgi:hypothetical protein